MSYLIKDLPKEEKPREKAKKKGIEALSNSELLAILLRCGTKDKSALEVAQDILREMESLKGLKNSKLNSLAKIKGVGEVKAITILSALELGYRLKNEDKKSFIKIRKTDDVYDNFKYLLENSLQEKFLVLFLNNQNLVINYQIMFVGVSNQSLVEPKFIFQEAILNGATRIIVMHNHPSGNPEPSREDYFITDRIKEIGILLDIHLMDHLIIGNDSYFTFFDYLRKE